MAISDLFKNMTKRGKKRIRKSDYNDINKAETASYEKFHLISVDELTKQLNTSLTDGLDSNVASQSLLKLGRNKITIKKRNPFARVFGYFFSGFSSLFLVAAIICILAWKPIGEMRGMTPDPVNLDLGVLLIFVIIIQAGFNAFQDWSSTKIMNSIKNMMPCMAYVIRNGKELTVPVEEIVVGDLIRLTYGNKVPADCRIVESHDLKIDKSMLTGESEAIDGEVESSNENYLESKNIAFMTTLITNGQGKGIVIATGDRTIMGKIADLTKETIVKKTSLQKEISRFVMIMVTGALICAIIVIATWSLWLRNAHPNYLSFPAFLVNTISVMIGFIPEGVPVSVTLSLLIIAKRMKKSRVLVKNLSVIETLSCVNVIASDKTGTLTQNKMFVAAAAAGLEIVDLNEASTSNFERTKAFNQLVFSCILCNNASFTDDEKVVPINQRKAKGDATDIALLRFTAEHENIVEINQNYSVEAEIPFNSKNKWMMKVVKPKNLEIHKHVYGQDAENEKDIEGEFILLKGAPDYLLKKSTHIIQPDGNMVPLRTNIIANLIKTQNDWCVLGQRVLLICKKKIDLSSVLTSATTSSNSQLEEYVNKSDDFCIIGLVGIIDPPREGIADVITKCRQAGIRVFMVTGDYALTAAAIALQIGIFSRPEIDTAETMRLKHKINDEPYEKSSLLLTGSDLENLTADDWRLVTSYEEIVLARTTPDQKLRSVKEFQRDGYIVGVTGDGVNDAPALKSADIGIAMGSGSDVAMEASQLVLLDNNFASILIAILNGRLVFDNLKKVILYLLPGGCFAELIPMLFSIFLGIPQNISSFQMLIISLFTDIAPSLSLMMEKPETDLLKQPPRSKKDHLTDWKFFVHAYFFMGILIAFSSQFMFFLYMFSASGLTPNQIFFSFDQLTNIYNSTITLHHNNDSIISGNFKSPIDLSNPETLNAKFNEIYYRGQTVTFVSIVLLQITSNLMSTRTRRQSFFSQSPWNKSTRNFWIFGAQMVSASIMILVVNVPTFHDLFNARPLTADFLLLPLVFCLIIFVLDELRKLCARNKFLFFHRAAW